MRCAEKEKKKGVGLGVYEMAIVRMRLEMGRALLCLLALLASLLGWSELGMDDIAALCQCTCYAMLCLSLYMQPSTI